MDCRSIEDSRGVVGVVGSPNDGDLESRTMKRYSSGNLASTQAADKEIQSSIRLAAAFLICGCSVYSGITAVFTQTALFDHCFGEDAV
jgi:hypothetical protein